MNPVPAPIPPRWQIERRSVVESTQDVLNALLAVNPRDRLVVVAEQQSGGRGRGGSSWESPRGGLWCSFSLLHPGSPDPFLGLLIGLAARDAMVAELAPGADEVLRLKWPNDQVIAERKWGGILLEAENLDGASLVRVGLGLNLDVPLSALQDVAGSPNPATSLRVEFGSSPPPEVALPGILQQVDAVLTDHQRLGRAASRQRVEGVMSTLGRVIRWNRGGPDEVGVARGLDDDGALIVDGTNGVQQHLHTATIRHVRSLP